MRVMYLLFSFTTGGTEKLVTDICNEMVKKNHKVYLYIVNDLADAQMLVTLDKRVHIEWQKREPTSGKMLSTVIRVTRFIKKNKIDVVHCNSLNAPELLLLKNLFFPATKVFCTIHDLGQYKRLKKWRITYRNILCRKIIAISQSVKNDLIKYGAKPDKVTVVYNAIDMKKFGAKQAKDPKEHLVIGNVARIVPEKKGQDILIDAMQKVTCVYPDAICYFAGGYDAQHATDFIALQKKVGQMGLDKNVKFLGNVLDIPSFLQRLDIFVLPSRFEGFGISLIEAMAMGIPCIASNLGGPAELIHNCRCGHLFHVSDVGELTQTILRVAEELDVEKSRAQNNAVYVRKTFDIQSMCSTLMQIYEQ